MTIVRTPRTPLDWVILISYPLLCSLAAFGYWWNRRSFYFFGILVLGLRFLFLLITSAPDTLLTDVPTLLWGSWGYWFLLEWLHEWTVKVRNRWYRKIFVAVVLFNILIYTADMIVDYFADSNLDGADKSGLSDTKQVIFAVFFLLLAVGLVILLVLLRPLLKDGYLSDSTQTRTGFLVLWAGLVTIFCVLLRSLFDILSINSDFFQRLVVQSNGGAFVQEVLPSFTLLCVQLALPKTLSPGERVTLLPPKMVANNDLLLDIPMSPLTNRPNLSIRRLVNDSSIRKIRSSELQQDEGPLSLLGSGSSGVVYKAVWNRPKEGNVPATQIPVAVKVMKLLPQLVAQANLDKFLLEVILTARLSRHTDYIVYLHGVVLDRFQEHGEISIVSELMDCDLSRIASQLSPKQKLVALLHVAKGLHFLHSSIPPVIHRDLKTANVLIGHFRNNKTNRWKHQASSSAAAAAAAVPSLQMICKIADLGVSTLALNHQHTTQVGTAYIMAPEVLHKHGQRMSINQLPQQHHQQQGYNNNNEDDDDNNGYGGENEPSYGTAVDIYAWAIIANELWTGNPFMMADDDEDTYRFASKFDDAIRDGTLRPQTSPDCPAIIVNLIKECWTSDPSLRPTAQELIRRLRRIIRMADQLFPEPAYETMPFSSHPQESSLATGLTTTSPESTTSSSTQEPPNVRLPPSRNLPVSPRPVTAKKKHHPDEPETPLLSAMVLNPNFRAFPPENKEDSESDEGARWAA